MNLTLKKAEPTDIDALADVLNASWKSAYRGMIPDEDLEKFTDHERRKNIITEGMSYSDRNYYLAMDDGTPCGMFLFCPSRDSDLPDYFDIVCFYTIKEYWGSGLGRRMMSYALQRIQKSGGSRVLLWALKENVRARRFYEKCGFVLNSEKRDSGFSREVPEVRYVLDLKEPNSLLENEVSG